MCMKNTLILHKHLLKRIFNTLNKHKSVQMALSRHKSKMMVIHLIYWLMRKIPINQYFHKYGCVSQLADFQLQSFCKMFWMEWIDGFKKANKHKSTVSKKGGIHYCVYLSMNGGCWCLLFAHSSQQRLAMR